MDIKLIIICQYFFIGFKKYTPPVLEVYDILWDFSVNAKLF